MASASASLVKAAGKSASAPTFIDVADLTMGDSYPTGGEAVKAALESAIGGSKEILSVLVINFDEASDQAEYKPFYDYASGKMLFTETTTDAEVANATDLSSVTLTCLVISQ